MYLVIALFIFLGLSHSCEPEASRFLMESNDSDTLLIGEVSGCYYSGPDTIISLSEMTDTANSTPENLLKKEYLMLAQKNYQGYLINYRNEYDKKIASEEIPDFDLAGKYFQDSITALILRSKTLYGEILRIKYEYRLTRNFLFPWARYIREDSGMYKFTHELSEKAEEVNLLLDAFDTSKLIAPQFDSTKYLGINFISDSSNVGMVKLWLKWNKIEPISYNFSQYDTNRIQDLGANTRTAILRALEIARIYKERNLNALKSSWEEGDRIHIDSINVGSNKDFEYQGYFDKASSISIVGFSMYNGKALVYLKDPRVSFPILVKMKKMGDTFLLFSGFEDFLYELLLESEHVKSHLL